MARWLSHFLVGLTFALAGSAVLAEEDPFGPPPPLPPENAEPVLPTVPKGTSPVAVNPPVTTPRPHVVPPAPTGAQKHVHERAAEAARQRKARIQQRKQAPQTVAPLSFPTTGPLSHPALLRNDPGIAIAFRPIALAGLDPLPNARPARQPDRKRVAAPIKKDGNPPVEQPVPPESIMSTTPPTQR